MKLYTKPQCSDCVKTKVLLEEHNIKYEAIDISTAEGFADFQENFTKRYPHGRRVCLTGNTKLLN